MKHFPFQFESTKKTEFFPEYRKGLPGHVLEIGPGRGDLMLILAEANPNQQWVAIELCSTRFAKLKARIEKRNLKNILLVNGDARVIIANEMRENQFEQIFVLFPDPWPKKRHAPRRILQLEFLWILTHILKPSGHFVLGTDVESYAHWALDNLRQITALEDALGHVAAKLPELPTTYFEKKWLDEGRSTFFLKFRKK